MQPQYRNFAPQVPQRSPHGSNQRRGGIGPMMSSGPHPSIPLTQAQIVQQQQAQAHASELAKRRSRRPTDKSMPDGVDEVIIDPDGVQRYRDLRTAERLLDAATTRKRLDVFDTVNRRNGKIRKTLRIWITNLVEDQVWQASGLNVDAFDFTPNMEASYRVKIEGRLLDEDHENLDSLNDGPNSISSFTTYSATPDEMKEGVELWRNNQNGYRFSHFFKAMSVDFDQSRLRNGTEPVVEWNKPDTITRGQSSSTNLPAAADFDELTFKRSGDESINITINLHRHEVPERYKLSSELADVLDLTEATQQEAVTGLWEYIRSMGLQEDDEKRNFRCDELLKKVIRRGDIGHIPMLNDYVAQHIQPLPPISLPYTVRVDEAFHKSPKPTIYDVQVAIDDPLQVALQSLVNDPQYATMLKEVTSLDEQLARLVQAISVSKAKHSFFESLGGDPANFVKDWLSSQKRDLEIIKGDVSRGSGDDVFADEWRRGGDNSVWASQNARESVNVLLSRQR